MTDTEMVKVMEVCKDKEMPCDDCPLVEYGDCEEISRQYFYDRFKQLKAENAALRERLEKAVELPRIERIFNGKVGSYKVVYQDKNNRITSEHYSEEKREAAKARLAELKGGKKDD